MSKRIVRGEREIARAMQEHGAAVYAVALAQTRCREDAQDVAQDVFVSLLTCEREFRDENHLRAWLLRATINRSLDMHRSAWRRRVQELPTQLEDRDEIAPAAPSPEDLVIAELESTRIWCALKRLPGLLRATAVLYYVEECSVGEIARIMQCREGTVRVRLLRVRRQMRDALTNGDEPIGGDEHEAQRTREGAQPGSWREAAR